LQNAVAGLVDDLEARADWGAAQSRTTPPSKPSAHEIANAHGKKDGNGNGDVEDQHEMNIDYDYGSDEDGHGDGGLGGMGRAVQVDPIC
jgi:hypothetical protein